MKRLSSLVLLVILLTACGAETVTPVADVSPTPSPVPATPSPAPSVTPRQATSTPVDSYGPADFPPDVNPLTGKPVANPSLLERRPMVIKIPNLPRSVRPQWGLSLADIVFEYYTEQGTTRFAAIFYGNDAEMVGPIRSARFIDVHIVRGYKAIFAFGLAYEKVLERLYNSEFADRLVVEGSSTPLFRYDPNGYNYLMVNTAELSAYMTSKGVENGRQNLDGMYFKATPPAGGQPAEQFTIRFSGAVYNRWQYDPETGRYLRFAETTEDYNNGQNLQYELLTDRLTGEPIAFDNVVVIFVLSEYYNRNPEVMDIMLLGSGMAYAFRDGQVYQVQWQRPAPDAVVSLAYPDGTPFPFKPGTTFFEVIGQGSSVSETEQGLHFVNLMP